MSKQQLFSVSHLIAAFVAAGLRVTSKPTLYKYEQLGVIKPGSHSLMYGKRIERLFTAEEIAKNIERYQKYTTEKRAALHDK